MAQQRLQDPELVRASRVRGAKLDKLMIKRLRAFYIATALFILCCLVG